MPRYDIDIKVRRIGKGRWNHVEGLRVDPEAPTAVEAFGEVIEVFRKMLALRDKGDERP